MTSSNAPVIFEDPNDRTRVARSDFPVADDDTPFGSDYLGGLWVS